MASGMGFGDNAKASLITRGLAEIARLGAEHVVRVLYEGVTPQDMVTSLMLREAKPELHGLDRYQYA
jgi:glycerol-3-phosphate dehydrogenase